MGNYSRIAQMIRDLKEVNIIRPEDDIIFYYLQERRGLISNFRFSVYFNANEDYEDDDTRAKNVEQAFFETLPDLKDFYETITSETEVHFNPKNEAN